MDLSIPTAVGVTPKCRHCGHDLTLKLIDLGLSPVANDYVDAANYMKAEPFYPLETLVCRECRLAQTRDLLAAADIFRADYAYFSSHSTSWLEHARSYVDDVVGRFKLGPASRHVEIASNDGYLLQYSIKKGISCLGIEPCESVALAAREKEIETRIEFFGSAYANELRGEGWSGDLITANNVLAHVPDINDFVGGVKILLAPEGVATFEVQHLLTLMQRHQFDTIYHEHFSYLSLKKIVGYGAPAKGVTLLNYCGVRTDFLDFTVDRAPSKQGRYLPGARIPILPPEAILEAKPDYVLILPWNIKNEIKTQMAEIRSWGGRFIVPVPKATIEE